MKVRMPRIAKTSWKAQITPKTLPTAGMALKSEVMMSFIPSLRASSRSGRSTRRMRSCLSGRSAGMPVARRTRSEIHTMKKSSTFQGSLRKDVLPLRMRPCATTLNMSSNVKRIVK